MTPQAFYLQRAGDPAPDLPDFVPQFLFRRADDALVYVCWPKGWASRFRWFLPLDVGRDRFAGERPRGYVRAPSMHGWCFDVMRYVRPIAWPFYALVWLKDYSKARFFYWLFRHGGLASKEGEIARWRDVRWPRRRKA